MYNRGHLQKRGVLNFLVSTMIKLLTERAKVVAHTLVTDGTDNHVLSGQGFSVAQSSDELALVTALEAKGCLAHYDFVYEPSVKLPTAQTADFAKIIADLMAQVKGLTGEIATLKSTNNNSSAGGAPQPPVV